MRIAPIILCRMDSNRLPGKGLKEVHSRPLLDYIVDRLDLVADLSTYIVATTERSIDDDLATYATGRGLLCYRGDLNDVAKRTLDCAEKFELDAFLRVNGDSPFVAPELLNLGCKKFLGGEYDLVTNVLERTYPYGLSVEVVSIEAMRQACLDMNSQPHREHVTKYFYDNQNKFRIHNIHSNKPGYQGIQLAVDTPEDLSRFDWMLSHLGSEWPNVDIDRLVNLATKFESI